MVSSDNAFALSSYSLVPSSPQKISSSSRHVSSLSPVSSSCFSLNAHPVSSSSHVPPLSSDVSPMFSPFSSVSSPSPSSASVLDPFFSSFPSMDRRTASSVFATLRNSLPPSPTNPYTPLQLASVWLTEQFTKNPFVDLGAGDESSFLYKKVANKTRPVATTLPENFRIIRHDHPSPLASLRPLPVNPPDFVPTGRFTRERRTKMDIGRDLLLPEEIKLAEWIVAQHNAAFAWTDDERGSFDPKYFAPIEIPHISHIPWVLKQGPIPRGILREVIKIIEDKWRSGVYEPSSSSYNSRWFCVFKKDGKSLRLVHSLEPLNAVTVRNAAMPPYTEVVAEDFAGRSIYTTLDLYVSFDQRQIHEKSRDMTTFNTPLGSFRLTVLPMGWTNSPAVLQGDITHILRPEIPHWTQPFADDVPIKGPKTRYELPDGSYETIPGNSGIRRFVWEHLEAVHRIVQRVESYGATFSGKKSFIGVPSADILGHVCTYAGRIADPSRVQAIQDWPIPKTVSEVRAFLGTCGVLRIFIKGYTLIARPLIQLTRKDAEFEIGPSQLESIRRIKEAILSSPALRPIEYDCDREVILAVDSCANGVGYILFQVGANGKRYPSRFGSITFNDRESRYSQAKLELYGLFRALRHTQIYTIGVRHLVVEMDAKFVKGMINSPTLHPNDAINRWISAILLFDFELVHVPAEKHTGADGLSRRPLAQEDPPRDDGEELEDWIDSNAGFFVDLHSPSSSDPLLSFVQSRVLGSPVFSSSVSPSVSSSSSMSSAPLVSPSSSVSSLSQPPSPSPSVEIPRSPKAVRREEKLALVRKFLTDFQRPPDLSDEQYRLFLRHASEFFFYNGSLFRKNKSGNPQLVPEPHERLELISYAHDVLGHKGIFATTQSLQVRFWWPEIAKDVRWYVRTCHECQVRQTRYFHIPPVVPSIPSLFRKAHMDTFFMPKIGHYRYVLHARCAMSSWPEARATTSDSKRTIALFIFQDILCRWGGIGEIITDNAAPWIAAADELGVLYGIHHIKISGYNSQANGIVESKHFDVRESIMKTCRGKESKWREVLPQVLWAERVTIRKSTGYSPFFLVHGVHPLLPFDFLEATYLAPTQDFGMSTEDLVALRAQQLGRRPEELEDMRLRVAKSRQQYLVQFEKRHHSRIVDFNFESGALVLVRNTRIEESLNRKTKPRYYGPMVVVRKTIGTSYIVAELDGAQSQLRIAGFRLVPYFPRSFSSIPIVSDVDEYDDATWDDPEDVRFLSSLSDEDRDYLFIPFTSF